MKYLYYCNSAYQLVNVLNLNWHRKYSNFESIYNYESDLILLNAFNGASEIVDILKKDDTFGKVILVNRFNNKGLLHRISSLFDIIFPMRYLVKSGSFIKKEVKNKYDYICAPKVSKITLSMWLLNNKAKVQLYEEGMGTYYGGQHMCYESNTHQELYQVLNGNKQFSQYEYIYVNDKRLYLGNDKEKVIDIPKFNKKYIDELRKKFSDILLSDVGKDIYWIGQYLIGANSNDDINSTIANSLKPFNNNTVFLPHPRIKMDMNDSFNKLESNKIWELSLLNINDVEEKCFVSIYSTAIFSAKLLYDLEPFMILTIKLLKDEEKEHYKVMERIIDLFKETYKDKSKVMIPETREELNICIEKYTKR